MTREDAISKKKNNVKTWYLKNDKTDIAQKVESLNIIYQMPEYFREK